MEGRSKVKMNGEREAAGDLGREAREGGRKSVGEGRLWCGSGVSLSTLPSAAT